METTNAHVGRIRDARGRSVTQLDPVKLHLLNLRSIIPADTLRSMSDAILPEARRQRLMQLLSMGLSFLVVVGGTIIYFTHFSTWKGLDLVSMAIYIVQFLVIVSGPVIAFRMLKSKYVSRIATVMLHHRHCPHCGYDIRGLPVDPTDKATVCPECGCAWKLGDSPADETSDNGARGRAGDTSGGVCDESVSR